MALRSIDLMIGDWVKSRGKIEQVTSVYEGYICTNSFEDSHDYYFDPIPLTPKILEKNGFTNGEFYAESHIEDWQIMSDGSYLAARSERGWCIDIPCRYVHELQHALRLCGIEKEITI